MKEIKNIWRRFLQENHQDDNWWERKKLNCRDRNALIKNIDVQGKAHDKKHSAETSVYDLYIGCDIEQGDYHYREEIVKPYQFDMTEGKITNHVPIKHPRPRQAISVMKIHDNVGGEGAFSYDRDAAVSYANKWWNSHNPEYETFRVDCTNYVSQCLYAGGAPMRGNPVREEGWWYDGGTWSFSWSVSHSLYWYLKTSTQGLTATEAEKPEELMPGDVICYDFEGDLKWDHTTIVVAKDNENMPLVNAHTDNSKNRYWAYEDSLAWTDRTAYTFFRITD